MGKRRWVAISVIAVIAVSVEQIHAQSMGTAFTYQGRLVKNGTVVDASCDLDFGLWDADIGGSQVGASPQSVSAVSVNDGLFTVILDFDTGAFDGDARWLEIAVQCPGDAMPIVLTPRQELTPAPYALALPGLYTQQNSVSPNLIGGYAGNTVAPGSNGVVIGGGGAAGQENAAEGGFVTVSGGIENVAGSAWSTVGGGVSNSATGATATIAGGGFNNATNEGSAVGGGNFNDARGMDSTIPGGRGNLAGGDHSFAAGHLARVRDPALVGGGDVDGDEGTFVWADDSPPSFFTSTGPNQFLIRAAGGVGIGTNAPAAQLDVAGNIHADGTIASGASITIDGGARTITSDENLELRIANGRALRMESIAGGSPNMIGGYSGNSAISGVRGATIAGGGDPQTAGSDNVVTDFFGTVSGGSSNQAGNAIGAVTDASHATVCGGFANTASGGLSTVAGGDNNIASGIRSFVGAGTSNQANGNSAAIPGGVQNSAGGEFSFAAGHLAVVRDATMVGGGDTNGDEGTFVWSDDSSPSFFTSTGPNKFLIRAQGGVGIGTNAPTEQLEVNGTVRMTGFELPTGAVAGRVLRSDASGTGTWQALPVPSNDWTTTGNVGTNSATNFIGTTDNQGLSLRTNSLTRMTVTSSGSVGIGTTAPATDLEVVGNSLVRDGVFTISATGTTRAARLVQNQGGSAPALQLTQDTNNASLSWDFGVNSLGTLFMSHPGNPAVFNLTTDGKLGLNSSFPTHPFQVGIDPSNGNGAFCTAGGTWTNVCDRDKKTGFAPIDSREVLALLSRMPIGEWRYKGESETVRHVGPVAQDFRAAFGLGESDKHIGTVDADGIALAAIQGLNEVVQDRTCEIVELRSEIESLRAIVNQLTLQSNGGSR